METITDQNAIVTGGTSGIGLQIAGDLLEEEANVAICARSPDDLEETARDLSDDRRHLLTRSMNVRNSEACSRFVDETVEEFGGLDILVNNAGVGLFEDVENISDEEWDRTIETNLTGAFFMTREAIPHLRKGDEPGHILFLSSLAGKNTFEGGSAYCASKFGLNALAETVMLEERHNDIKVSWIAPGSVHTDFSERDISEWALKPEDISKSVLDILKHRRNAHESYVELRPYQPPQGD